MTASLMLAGCAMAFGDGSQVYYGNNEGAAAASSVSHKDRHDRHKHGYTAKERKALDRLVKQTS
jgi:hypothetical protein